MQVDILNSKGSKTGRTVELPEEIFGIEPNEHVVHLAVKQFLAAWYFIVGKQFVDIGIV